MLGLDLPQLQMMLEMFFFCLQARDMSGKHVVHCMSKVYEVRQVSGT
jgi:hypothetical protein